MLIGLETLGHVVLILGVLTTLTLAFAGERLFRRLLTVTVAARRTLLSSRR
jgi:hypothetical protein